jgi:hypothetical protein
MLFAKGLSILFSLFAGLESAKGALYHYVCGKGQERLFPYLDKVREYLLSNTYLIADEFVFDTQRLLEPKSIFDCVESTYSFWQDDLFYTVGGFTIKCSLQEEGILFELEDYYDWHSGSQWWIPEDIVEKLPKWLIKQLPKLGFQEYEGCCFFIEEELLSSFGQSYWHKGCFLVPYKEFGGFPSCSLERTRALLG